MMRRIFLVFMVSFCFGCEKASQDIQFTGQTMGTTYKVVVSDTSGTLDPALIETTIESTLESVNASYSNWDPNSEVSLFNTDSSLTPQPISDGFRDMLELAQTANLATNGSFDLTLTPVINIWGFGPNGTITKRPTDSEISAAMSKVGQRSVIELSEDGKTLQKRHPEASVYLTAVAKGFGIDAVSQALRNLGAENFMVEIGGDLYVSGVNSRNSEWRIGIERPDANRQTVEEVIEISNVGMATSGDYRNYFEQNGIRYSHIIDGVTGRPVTHKTASVTVIADTAAKADAWATALLAVGVERGMTIANENELDVLFIVRSQTDAPDAFELVSNTGFDKYLPTNKD